MSADNGALTKVLESNLQCLSTIANVCMLWWVSSVVFSGSALSTVWLNLEKGKALPWPNLLAAIIFITTLFASMIVFGGWMIRTTRKLQAETTGILGELGEKRYFGQPVFRGIVVGVAIGSSNFFIVLVAWLMICYDILAGRT